MSDPQVIGDRERYARVGREYHELEPGAKLAADWRRAADDAAGARELIGEGGDDPELRELLASSPERLTALEGEIGLGLGGRGPDDDRSGVGGVGACRGGACA